MSQDKKYDNKNQVAVWRYTKDDEKYHLSGYANVTCPHCQQEIDMWANGWTNKGQGNQPLVKLKIYPKETNTQTAQETNSSDDPFAALNLEEDIPF